MSIEQEVDIMIRKASNGRDKPKTISLPMDKYTRLYEALEPIYKQQYGGIIRASWELERENILYSGVAIVLEGNGTK